MAVCRHRFSSGAGKITFDCYLCFSSGWVCTCGGRSNIEWQALNTTLCVTTSDPEAVVGVRL